MTATDDHSQMTLETYFSYLYDDYATGTLEKSDAASLRRQIATLTAFRAEMNATLHELVGAADDEADTERLRGQVRDARRTVAELEHRVRDVISGGNPLEDQEDPVSEGDSDARWLCFFAQFACTGSEPTLTQTLRGEHRLRYRLERVMAAVTGGQAMLRAAVEYAEAEIPRNEYIALVEREGRER